MKWVPYSFDFDNNESSKVLFAGQAKNEKTPYTISDWSSKSSLPQNQWERIIEDKISKTNMVVVLVGRSMSTAGGVVKEIIFAKNNNVPIFGVYVDGANSVSNLPSGLARNRVISWTWPNVFSAINQMMNEGKNKN